jgi:hypothetical protein
MAHPQGNEWDGFVISRADMACGVVGCDTLAVAAPVELTQEACRALLTLTDDESCERLARWPGQPPRILAPEDLTEGADWEARRCRMTGLGAYQMLIRLLGEGDGISLAIRQGKPGQAVPQGFYGRLMLGSELLWRTRLRDGQMVAVTEAWAWGMLTSRGALRIMPKVEDRTVRRLDLACDHWGPDAEWERGDLERFATRAQGRGECWHYDPDAWTYEGARSRTFYLGRRGAKAAFLRIYRKDAEAEETGKLRWIAPVWKRWGWDGERTVWRSEIECGGEWLSNHGMTDARGLRGCEAALWREWTARTRLTDCERGRATLKRGRTHPRWQALQAAPVIAPQGEAWEWVTRPRPESRDMLALRKQAAGCLLRVHQLMGDDPDGWAALMTMAMHDVAEARHRKG